MRYFAGSGLSATSFRTVPRFRLIQAVNVDEAVSALAAAERPAVLAGGTDLPARFNEGFAPSDVIDIARLEPLREVRVDHQQLVIGAAVTHAVGCDHPLVRRHIPGFGEAWARIANVRIRLSATLGGNLMARRTRYEGAILMAALDAQLRFQTTMGEVQIRSSDLFNVEALPKRALLTAIVIPLRPGLRLDYDRSLRPVVTQAVAIDASRRTTLVTATEYAVPRTRVLHGSVQGLELLQPVHFDDDRVTDGTYLNRVRNVLFARQLQRLGAA